MPRPDTVGCERIVASFSSMTAHGITSLLLATAPLAGRSDVGALRLRLVATKDRPCHDFPLRDERGSYLPEILLDLDYWALIPRRAVAA